MVLVSFSIFHLKNESQNKCAPQTKSNENKVKTKQNKTKITRKTKNL